MALEEHNLCSLWYHILCLSYVWLHSLHILWCKGFPLTGSCRIIDSLHSSNFPCSVMDNSGRLSCRDLGKCKVHRFRVHAL